MKQNLLLCSLISAFIVPSSAFADARLTTAKPLREVPSLKSKSNGERPHVNLKDLLAKPEKIRIENKTATASKKSASEEFTADFSSANSSKTIYYQGFDSFDEVSDWSLSSLNSENTWALGNLNGSHFSSINPNSIYSLIIGYDDDFSQDEKFISPEIAIKENCSLNFYASFHGVFSQFANLYIYAIDTETEESEVIFDAFSYSQANDHTYPKWLNFEASLEKWSGRNVIFVIQYVGQGGDVAIIDDFKIIMKDDSPESKISVESGETVSFTNLSEGNYWFCEWTFEGGDPATSDEEEPSVTYNTPGVYDVTLKVYDNTNSATVTKTGYVTVTGKAPSVSIAKPEGTYNVADAADFFVPAKEYIKMTTECTDPDAAFSWSFEGADIATSADPVVSLKYLSEGAYRATVTAKNEFGSDADIKDFIAGGTAGIWNITTAENEDLDMLSLGWFGNYGGSNWLGLSGFAEHFDKPAVPMEISEVDVYFYQTDNITPDAEITLAVTKSENGLPGEVLASSVLKVADLQCDDYYWVATTFELNATATVEDEFFITVCGFPNNESNEGVDNIAMACVRREPGEPGTSYQLVDTWDENDQPTGESEWFENVDEAVSFAIVPNAKYTESIDDAINDIRKEVGQVEIYSVEGLFLGNADSDNFNRKLSKGIYIIKGDNMVRKVMVR